jgi:Lon protease-like protein
VVLLQCNRPKSNLLSSAREFIEFIETKIVKTLESIGFRKIPSIDWHFAFMHLHFLVLCLGSWLVSIEYGHAWASFCIYRSFPSGSGRSIGRGAVKSRVSFAANQKWRLRLGLEKEDDSTANDARKQLDDLEKEEDLKRRNELRMGIVRSLQATFYKPTAFFDSSQPPQIEDWEQSNDDKAYITADTDQNEEYEQCFPMWENGSNILSNLPVWFVGWTELPGRTNVLSINKPVYTNMFESILRRYENSGDNEGSCYFGHVYRDDTKSGLDDNDNKLLGTLIRISDYRRMQGGTLLLLVQAMDRFQVITMLQERPYGVAHVQLWPDQEEIVPPDTAVTNTTANARTAAGLDAWSRWYPYEYKQTVFALPNITYSAIASISGAALNAVLPFAEYDLLLTHDTASQSQPPSGTIDKPSQPPSAAGAAPLAPNKTTSPSVEVGLVLDINEENATWPIAARTNVSLDELEIRMWLKLNDAYAATNSTPSPVLLSLLPPDQMWPSDFVLSNMNASRVSPFYPASRRQKRLSYSAPHLLERVASATADSGRLNDFRQELLRLPR